MPSPVQPTDAAARQLAKSLMRTARFGALASLVPGSGAPQVTRIGVATDFDGAPIALISSLAAHSGALLADPRCSLLVGEPGKGDPLAHARLTLMAEARTIPPDHAGHAHIAARFAAHQPKSALYAGLADFRFVRLTPLSARLTAGFGKTYDLTPAQILSDPDPELAAAEGPARAHMNADHAEAIALYARHYAKAPPGNWRLAGIDAEGIDIADGDAMLRIFFDTPLKTPQDMHARLVHMARTARAALMNI